MPLADEDIGAVILVQTLQTGSQIDVVADGGIVEQAVGAHVAHGHRTGVDAHPDLQHRPAHCLPMGVQIFQGDDHLQGGPAGQAGMVRLDQRGAEQGHDGIPHVLVDGAPVVDDDVAHGVQEIVQHPDQGFRVIFHVFPKWW